MSVPIVLASASAVRRRILADAGVAFEAVSPDVDEAAIKNAMLQQGAAVEAVARKLAEEKALAVSRLRPEAVVIGSDQILSLDGDVHDKARTMEEARARLLLLRGRDHLLVGGTALARDGALRTVHVETSRLKVRAFSDAFLDGYLAQAGEAILASVGCYQFEGLGAQLFEKVEGDYYAVLGLPLVATLSMLRAEGALSA